MNLKEALEILNISDYEQRIFSSNSRGELFHLQQYFHLAELANDNHWINSFFREWFVLVVEDASKKWERPESIYQHIESIFIDNLKQSSQSRRLSHEPN